MVFGQSFGRRVAFGAGAFLLADLITGLAAYSLITLGALWYFSYSWIQLQGEYAAHGLVFGSTTQLDLAWLGVLVTLPMMGVSIYLAWRAYRLPQTVYRLHDRGTH